MKYEFETVMPEVTVETSAYTIRCGQTQVGIFKSDNELNLWSPTREWRRTGDDQALPYEEMLRLATDAVRGREERCMARELLSDIFEANENEGS